MNSSEKATKLDQIIMQLKRYKASGLKFEDAKVRLLDQGFSESEIAQATGYYQYEGAQPQSDIPAQVTEYFNKHPDQALADGDKLLRAYNKERISDERRQAILDATASQAAGELGVGNADAQAEYESKFAYDVGISFWLLYFSGIVLDIGCFLLVRWLNIPQWFYLINTVMTLILVAVLINRRIR